MDGKTLFFDVSLQQRQEVCVITTDDESILEVFINGTNDVVEVMRYDGALVIRGVACVLLISEGVVKTCDSAAIIIEDAVLIWKAVVLISETVVPIRNCEVPIRKAVILVTERVVLIRVSVAFRNRVVLFCNVIGLLSRKFVSSL